MLRAVVCLALIIGTGTPGLAETITFDCGDGGTHKVDLTAHKADGHAARISDSKIDWTEQRPLAVAYWSIDRKAQVLRQVTAARSATDASGVFHSRPFRCSTREVPQSN